MLSAKTILMMTIGHNLIAAMNMKNNKHIGPHVSDNNLNLIAGGAALS